MRLQNLVLVLALAVGAGSACADPLQDAAAAVNRKDYATAVKLLEPLAQSGNPVAQSRLALLYFNGHGVAESNALAFMWFERAARKGLADAQFHLANMYAYGLVDLPADEDPNRLAAQWYFEAAMQGHADAQYSLGIMFLTGSGVTQSNDEGQKWIGRAAAQGHADARAYQAGQLKPAAPAASQPAKKP